MSQILYSSYSHNLMNRLFCLHSRASIAASLNVMESTVCICRKTLAKTPAKIVMHLAEPNGVYCICMSIPPLHGTCILSFASNMYDSLRHPPGSDAPMVQLALAVMGSSDLGRSLASFMAYVNLMHKVFHMFQQQEDHIHAKFISLASCKAVGQLCWTCL